MFDYVKVDTNKLPLTSEEKYIGKFNFQTKDFDRTLSTYEITNEGCFELTRDGTKQAVKLNPYCIINFYEYIDNVWFEFNAYFRDGKLIEILRFIED